MPAPGIMSSENPNWRTPPELFDPLNDEFRFDLDAAADQTSALLPKYFGPGSVLAENALAVRDWSMHAGSIWLNPPYSRKLRLSLEPWLQHASRQRAIVVALIPARTDTLWWHNVILPTATEVRFINGRVDFLHPDTGLPGTSGGSFPSALIVWEPRRSRVPRAPLVVPWSYRER